VFFTGYMDHSLLRLVLPTADIAVFPSLVPESFGLVVLEAASAGVVPLVSDFSGLRDSAHSFETSIQAFEDGALRFPTDPRTRLVGLGSRLEELLQLSQDVKVREELRDISKGSYSWLAVTKDLEAVYESVVNR
ncbi:MAG: glycosyltransferase, partial [Candidatus Thorarchaeota archaeon]